VPAEPDLPIVALGAAEGRPIEDRVVAHHELEASPGRRVGVIHVATLANEGAEAGRLGEVAGDVRPASAGVLGDDRRKGTLPALAAGDRDALDGLARRRFGLRETEVEVEVARR